MCFRVILEKKEKFWMEWMKFPFSLKKEENAGFEQAISENTIAKVLLIGYGSKCISELFVF